MPPMQRNRACARSCSLWPPASAIVTAPRRSPSAWTSVTWVAAGPRSAGAPRCARPGRRTSRTEPARRAPASSLALRRSRVPHGLSRRVTGADHDDVVAPAAGCLATSGAVVDARSRSSATPSTSSRRHPCRRRKHRVGGHFVATVDLQRRRAARAWPLPTTPRRSTSSAPKRSAWRPRAGRARLRRCHPRIRRSSRSWPCEKPAARDVRLDHDRREAVGCCVDRGAEARRSRADDREVVVRLRGRRRDLPCLREHAIVAAV